MNHNFVFSKMCEINKQLIMLVVLFENAYISVWVWKCKQTCLQSVDDVRMHFGCFKLARFIKNILSTFFTNNVPRNKAACCEDAFWFSAKPLPLIMLNVGSFSILKHIFILAKFILSSKRVTRQG